MPLKIMPVYGTRPEAIKMAPIIRSLQADTNLDCVPVITGQHREMLSQVNDLFGIEPAHDLDIFEHGLSISGIVSRTLDRLTPILDADRPDAIIAQGDTTSAFAAGLAGFYSKIPVIHVEAGLRTDSIASPYPEEGNRRLLTQISELHLAPTQMSRDNLLREGVAPHSVYVTGNSVIDAFLDVTSQDKPISDQAIRRLVESGRRIVLVTSHRRESWGEPMRRTATAIEALADLYPDTYFVLPMHANPAVQAVFKDALSERKNVVLSQALDYIDFAQLIKASTLVLTDSGGVQEEAPSLGKPVLVLREDTERPEAMTAGTARLIGTDTDRIISETRALLDDPVQYSIMANSVNPYGDGQAAERTRSAILEHFGRGRRLPEFII